jgi:hypothetical protein
VAGSKKVCSASQSGVSWKAIAEERFHFAPKPGVCVTTWGNWLIFVRATKRRPAAFLTLTKMINEKFENQRLRREIGWERGWRIIMRAKEECANVGIFQVRQCLAQENFL